MCLRVFGIRTVTISTSNCVDTHQNLQELFTFADRCREKRTDKPTDLKRIPPIRAHDIATQK